MFIEDNAQFHHCGCGQAQSTGTCPEIGRGRPRPAPSSRASKWWSQGYSRMLYIELLIYIDLYRSLKTIKNLFNIDHEIDR
jgi:hypothetical protein